LQLLLALNVAQFLRQLLGSKWWGTTWQQRAAIQQLPADQVMKKAFDEGWGGVICKTLSLDSKKVCGVSH
jgi:hypothetical protein